MIAKFVSTQMGLILLQEMFLGEGEIKSDEKVEGEQS